MKPSSKQPTKLYFTAGPRAIKYLTQASRSLSLSAQAIGVGRDGLVERSAKNEDQRRDLISREKDLKGELANMIAEKAVADAEGKGGVVWVQRQDKATHDFEFLGLIASAFTAATPQGAVVLVTSAPTGLSPSLMLIQSNEADRAKGVNERLKAALEGNEKGRVKGGGAKGRFMSKIDGNWGKKDVEMVEEVIQGVTALELTEDNEAVPSYG